MRVQVKWVTTPVVASAVVVAVMVLVVGIGPSSGSCGRGCRVAVRQPEFGEQPLRD